MKHGGFTLSPLAFKAAGFQFIGMVIVAEPAFPTGKRF